MGGCLVYANDESKLHAQPRSVYTHIPISILLERWLSG